MDRRFSRSDTNTTDVPVRVKWPISAVLDVRDEETGWAVVHSRIVSPERHALLAELRRANYRFIGMASDGLFPADATTNGLDYGMLCEGWCHCFRDPDGYLPPGTPRALISDSDFADVARLTDVARRPSKRMRSYDFVYVGAAEPWKREAKGERLAAACFEALAGAGWRGAAVGAPNLEGAPAAVVLPPQPWPSLLALVASARFVLVTSGPDASPRVIAESLCLDVPVVVYQGILGGWKYVNRFTGEFFDSADDVAAAAARCAESARSPHGWFRTHYGPYHAGMRLASFLRELDAGLTAEGPVSLRRDWDVDAGTGRSR